MRWLMTAAGLLGLSEAATAAEPAAPIAVMVLGSYHFDSPGLDLVNTKVDDVLKPQRQEELQALSDALATFRPTKIVVERVAKTPALLDHRYAEFTPADLGKNRDERYQIAYRLAQRLGMKTVYAIDEDPGPGEPDYFPFDKVAAWAKANGAQAKVDAALEEVKSVVAETERLQQEGSIAHVLAAMNRPERTEADQTFYYKVLALGDTEAQPGADLNAMWYLRNAKIFAKLMLVAKPGDRVLVVYGSGHNYWLRHFARTAPGYRAVDPTPYLQKADAATR
jgi:hypothetical protein